MREHKYYRSSYERNGSDFLVFDIPDGWKIDVDGYLQGSYSKLPNCCKVYAMCDETLILFLDPLDVTMDKISASQEGGSKWMEDDRRCDNCGVIMKLRYAKDTEIIALGLTVNDYE